MYELKIYRGIMCHDSEEWYKSWRETLVIKCGLMLLQTGLFVAWIIHIIHAIWMESRKANNPDYVDYKSHIKATMWLLVSSFSNLAPMWIIWIRYYSNCSHIQFTMLIFFGSHEKCGFKLDYVAHYIRNHYKPHSIHNVASDLL